MKKLVIQASNNYDSGFQVVPINALDPVVITSEFGTFKLLLSIKDFDGSSHHQENSIRNIADASPVSQKQWQVRPANLSFELTFTPNQPINGHELLFGNDCGYPIKDHIPILSLSTGLKLFNWFVNNTVRGKLDHEKPFLYGPLIGAATYLSPVSSGPDDFPNKVSTMDTSTDSLPEHLLLEFPTSKQRKKYFNKLDHCSSFRYQQGTTYHIKVDTNMISMSDCKYYINLPTFSSRTFKVNVGKYINDDFNNFNWVVKLNGQNSVDEGTVGLVVSFRVINE